METCRLAPGTPALSTAFLIPINRGADQVFELLEFTTIGRDPASKLWLADRFVSSYHARIERRPSGFTLRDQNSSNGTFLNGSRITEAQLDIGDQIRFGESVFAFSEISPTHAKLESLNPQWNEQLRRLPAFASTNFPVLLTGPSGTGKDVLAQWLHRHSPRASSPFVSINCSALNENLIESELFGHTRGSFTGAMSERKGAFEAARGGTLFLDEIGDLPLALQPKLLRALENKEIRAVGSDRVIETDVRILAATHANLVRAVQQEKFREDLYYRLNVCSVQVPALNDRMDDFETLLYQFARSLKVRFSHAAIAELKTHRWPGNIRELKNAVSRAAACFPGEHIQPHHVPSLIDVGIKAVDSDAVHFSVNTRPQGPVIREIERDMIIQRLVANRGNQRRTAEELGLPKSTLHDRIKQYKIDLTTILEAY